MVQEVVGSSPIGRPNGTGSLTFKKRTSFADVGGNPARFPTWSCESVVVFGV